jgi:hypothetical protein
MQQIANHLQSVQPRLQKWIEEGEDGETEHMGEWACKGQWYDMKLRTFSARRPTPAHQRSYQQCYRAISIIQEG